MTNPDPHSPPPPPPPAEPPPPAARPRSDLPLRRERKPVKKQHTPVKRAGEKPRQNVSTDDRRDFFSDAVREALSPFVGIIDKRINPILAALEAIPDEVERISKTDYAAEVDRMLPGSKAPLDQPQNAPQDNRTVALPQAAAQPVLRPPGAMMPGEFESVCSRCGHCVEACPAHAIQIDPYKYVGDGFPYIMAVNQPCVVCESLACMPSCPTGALKVVERLAIKLGTARVNRDLCLRESGEDCRLCVEICPITGPGAGDAGDAIFIHEPTGRIRVRKNACIGCGLCENRCPTNSQAITVAPFKGRQDPIIA